jgi:hypothetical protein
LDEKLNPGLGNQPGFSFSAKYLLLCKKGLETMVLEEILEHGVSMAKTVWHKRGDKISRQEVKRTVATDIKPRAYIEIKNEDEEAK